MLSEDAMQIKVNDKLIKWNGRHVTLPSGRKIRTDWFGGQLQYIAKEAKAGYESFLRELKSWGLTLQDVEQLLESDEPLTKQLSARSNDRVRCSRCHAVLWDPESIRRGMGPECATRR